MGSAKPQYLFFLLINQSCMFPSQSSSRSSPNTGIQLIFLALSTIRSLNVLASISGLVSFSSSPHSVSFELLVLSFEFVMGLSIAMYHSSATFHTSSLLHLQQAGYLCL